MTEDEVDSRLSANPADIEALICKGDFRREAGQMRSAAAFYRAALRAAAVAASAGPLPMALKKPLSHAQQCLADGERTFEQQLMDALDKAGFGAGLRPARFQQSLDLLTGRAQGYLQLQRPTAYYYPGLPQRTFYEREEFEWCDSLEAQTDAIRAELFDWLGRGGRGFTPYLVSDPARPLSGYHGLVDNPAWSTFYLTNNGEPEPDLLAHFPRTFETLSQVPLPRMGVRAPSILFSRLQPGAHIPPHHGMVNTRLICHLPLVVPDHCSFRVGSETRSWVPGQLLIFDDSVQHEAWNRGTTDRYLLIFDIWRPELGADERRAVTALFNVLDEETGTPPVPRKLDSTTTDQ